MCGIAGLWASGGPDRDALARMTDALAHRGPDADGAFVDGPVALGHRRLSVIDLAGSPQPMTSVDGRATIVFNGEIYNFRELREELRALGQRFATDGDTEVILAGWRAWGDGVLSRLSGMFAFALWDRDARTLLLARDHLGVKPLHYRLDARGGLAFASELKALAHAPGFAREVDLDAIGLYLEAQYVPAPRTVWRGVAKLPAAHAMRIDADGRASVWRYWSPTWTPKPALSDDEAVDALERELSRSVASMLVADVPLGAFLSGGIDSSLVAALMTRAANRPIDAFTIGFEGDAQGSEHEHAAAVARHLGARHHVLMLAPDAILQALDGWTDVFDEPFGDQAALPTLLLAGFARQRVTVALTGEGADEAFAGYGNYGRRLAEERITGPLGHAASPLPWLVRALPARLRKERLLRGIAEPLARRYQGISVQFDPGMRARLVSPALRARLAESLGDHVARAFDECGSPEYLDRLLHVDQRLWLADDLLVKVDRATMAHSLEARVPYLDHAFVEFCARLPARMKLRDGQTKWLLKRLALRHLPESVVHRRKQGFVMPVAAWLNGPLAAELNAALSARGLDGRGLFAPGALARLSGEHRAGRRNHGFRLWTLMMLERWFARWAPDFRLAPA
jgi:asparagine synthase (glutamine-hydrolysing)